MDDPDIDMFADLEKTLCEGLTNLCFTRTSNNNHPEIDVTCLENIKDLSKINGPAVRTYYLYKATKAFQNKQYLDSIYFETFALSLFMRIKFHANKIMEAERHMPTEENLANFLEEKPVDQPEIIDYLDRFLKDMLNDKTPARYLKSIEYENGTEMMNLCREFPEEWTIIQLCKQVNVEVFRQSRAETLLHPNLIFLTLFRYPMSERFDHKPIKIPLNQDGLNELYESSHSISAKLNAQDNSYEYFRKLSDNDFEEQIVSKMRKLLGPWIVMLSGKSKNSSYDDDIIAKVDLFLKKSQHKYSKRQNVLICLFSRRIHMLSKAYRTEIALYISKTKHEWWELEDFFEDLQLFCSTKSAPECYPVILILDEHLDHMYWEMCNPSQEFTRVDSMATLLKLYFHHQHNVTGGYVNVNGEKGSAVLNPDRTLPQFNEQVRPLVESLQDSSWKVLCEQEPTFLELREMLADSDVYIYCGHGSGLQFISAYETCQLTANAVVFLMGCSSVAFKADNGYSMGTAAHYYYHIAKSPAVIGHLNLTYVNMGAFCMDVVLGKWFTDLKNIDTNLFGKESNLVRYATKLNNCFNSTSPTAIQASPYLSAVISQLRQKGSIPIIFRAILCHRGLPVCRKKRVGKSVNRLKLKWKM